MWRKDKVCNMGAEIKYVVTVLHLVEAEVEVHAVTSSEAMEKAAKLPGIARVVKAEEHFDDGCPCGLGDDCDICV